MSYSLKLFSDLKKAPGSNPWSGSTPKLNFFHKMSWKSVDFFCNLLINKHRWIPNLHDGGEYIMVFCKCRCVPLVCSSWQSQISVSERPSLQSSVSWISHRKLERIADVPTSCQLSKENVKNTCGNNFCFALCPCAAPPPACAQNTGTSSTVKPDISVKPLQTIKSLVPPVWYILNCDFRMFLGAGQASKSCTNWTGQSGDITYI